MFTLYREMSGPKNNEGKYNINPSARPLLSETNDSYGEKLVYDAKAEVFEYNKDYKSPDASNGAGFSGSPKFSASFPMDSAKGMTVKDPDTESKVTFKPKYKLGDPRKEKNRLIYPIDSYNASKVISTGGAGFKEDIVLNEYKGDKISFTYELEMDDGLEARMQPDGSLGVYGVQKVLLGNVSTGSEADAKLLENARKNGEKTNLIFVFPAPFVKESNKSGTETKSKFILDGKRLTVETTGLKKANYPLTIDPSVYLDSATEFMRGNNETNIDFDVTNSLIEKGVLTGARFETWTATTALNAARWNGATVVAGGYIYLIGGSSGTTNFGNVYWAKLNTSTYTIDSPTPGSGAACTNWCTNTQYDLPSSQVRRGLSAVAYNGYLYAIGGKDAACAGTNTVCGTVYVAKVGANGEPISWTATSSLATDRSYFGATVYDNKIYVAGGQTDASLNGDSTLEYASIKPDGALSAWTVSGVALPATLWGHSMLQYNGYLYLIGGTSTATVQATVYYNKIQSTGLPASSWTATTSFGTARGTYGGNFATIGGGYIYIIGGCSAMTTTNCSTGISNANGQLASINADGTVSDWTAFTLTGSTGTLSGHGLAFWRNNIYSVGGCSVATTTSNCGTAITTTRYGAIKADGDVSPKTNETTLPAIGAANGQVGRHNAVVVVNDGWIYNAGGCAVNNCGSMSDNTAYAAIAADGTIGAWTVDNSGLRGTTGQGAAGGAVYNNYIYVVGGTSGAIGGFTRSIWRAPLNVDTDHSVGTWTEETNQLGSAYGMMGVFTRSYSGTSGNMYIVGGCESNTAAGIGCGASWKTDVLKCTIAHADGSIGGTCSTASQLQLQDFDGDVAGTQGLGAMAYAMWSDYLYLAGGVCGLGNGDGTAADTNSGCDGTSNTTGDNNYTTSETNKVWVAKINASGNIVKADVSANNEWQITSNKLPQSRRRGVAFAVNGYFYAAGGHDGTNGTDVTLSDVAFAKINPITGDLNAFTSASQGGSTNNIISSRWGHGYVAANGYLYFVGGCSAGAPANSCSSTTGGVESVQVYNNYSGSPYSYATTGLPATDRYGAGSVIHNGFIYLAGGCTSTTDCTTATANVEFAPINNDGTIGTWGNTTDNDLGTAQLRGWGKLVVAGNTLYFIGGQTSGSTNGNAQVYWGTPNTSTGQVTAWAQATNGLPAGRTDFGAAVWNDRIYVTGGRDAAGAVSNVVYASPDLSAGGDIGSAWTTTGMTAFTGARSGVTAITYSNTLYVLGGYNGTNYMNDVQYAAIASDGTIGSWAYGNSLPIMVRQASGFAANGYIYLFGGRQTDTTCSTNTYSTSIAGFGAGSSARYGIGQWSQTNVSYSTTRYGVAASYYQGRTYLIGGQCNSVLTGANRSYYSTLQAQPQKSIYSFYINTDIDVFANKFLLNGIDNGIGARWKMNYKSSADLTSAACATMTDWGQNTTYNTTGIVTLGTVSTYTPKDGSGTNIFCARYYYMSVSIDSTQAFGFPEDVSRGPTINDMSLFFTSNPSKRLRHGKSFTDGTQQPLDTPCGSPSC